MTPFYKDHLLTVYQSDVMDGLRELPNCSVHCCVTSPPYWGLRDYGVDGQIGLEKTPEAYVAKMVEVFREVKRVLRDDGTLWLNLGDSYASNAATNKGNPGGFESYRGSDTPTLNTDQQGRIAFRSKEIKGKDLVGIPWMVAFALRADGWVLRQEIIWEKPNPMPESVRDRCTKAHEQIFMFCKARWTGEYPPRTIPVADSRWLALLLEAEGCIAIRRYTHDRDVPQHALQISIANSDRSLLEEAQRISRCGAILNAKGTNRPMFYLQWTTKEAALLLWEMYPYLFGKRKQAEIGLMLESRRSNSNKGIRDDIFRKDGRHFFLKSQELELREKMWLAVKSLNQHKPVDLSWLAPIKEGRWITNKYFYDAEAVKETAVHEPEIRDRNGEGYNPSMGDGRDRFSPGKRSYGFEGTRNKRTVWTVPSQPYPESHFATFPEDLIKPCILAGTSAKGCCPQCGAPWERVVERSKAEYTPCGGHYQDDEIQLSKGKTRSQAGGMPIDDLKTVGWKPTCQCFPFHESNGNDHWSDVCPIKPVPCTVLDPFGGSFTTAQVSLELGRKSVIIELNPQYVALGMERTRVTPSLPLA